MMMSSGNRYKILHVNLQVSRHGKDYKKKKRIFLYNNNIDGNQIGWVSNRENCQIIFSMTDTQNA